MTGCAGTSRNAQIAAGERIGQAAAGANLERQPDECGKGFAVLDVPIGQEMATVWRRYETYVQGPINARIRNCFLFNQKQIDGLVGK